MNKKIELLNRCYTTLSNTSDKTEQAAVKKLICDTCSSIIDEMSSNNDSKTASYDKVLKVGK